MRFCLISLRSLLLSWFCFVVFIFLQFFFWQKKNGVSLIWCVFFFHSHARNWLKCLVAHRKREKEMYFKTILLLLLLFICLFTLFKINGLIGWKRDCESILYDVFMRSASFSALQYLSRWIAGYNLSTLLHIVIC